MEILLILLCTVCKLSRRNLGINTAMWISSLVLGPGRYLHGWITDAKRSLGSWYMSVLPSPKVLPASGIPLCIFPPNLGLRMHEEWIQETREWQTSVWTNWWLTIRNKMCNVTSTEILKRSYNIRNVRNSSFLKEAYSKPNMLWLSQNMYLLFLTLKNDFSSSSLVVVGIVFC